MIMMLFLSEVNKASCLFLSVRLQTNPERRDCLVTAAHRGLVGGTLASLRTGPAGGLLILDPCEMQLGAPCRAIELVVFCGKMLTRDW
jgi:hypothetical protein